MRDLLEALINSKLDPLIERIEDLSNEIEDLRRRNQSLIRLGKVLDIDTTGTLIRVQHGELKTPFIRWFASCAGQTIDYRCPSVGEQAVLLNYGGGNAGAQTVALIGLFSNDYPSPSNDPNEILRVYPDGSRVAYHATDHVMTIDVKGEVNVTATGNANVDAKNIHLNQGSPVVTTAHICHYTGNPHGDGSTTVTAGK